MMVEVGGYNMKREGYFQVDVIGSPDMVADIRALPFKHSLDGIYASHVFEHLEDADIVRAMKSCRAAIKPEGILEVYVPDLLWFMRRFLKASPGERWGLYGPMIFGTQSTKHMTHLTGFSVKRLQMCLVAAGFRKVEAKRVKRESRFGIMEIHGIATV